MLKDQIAGLAKQIHPDVVGFRRHLHQYPELSYQETETGRYIADRLAEMGVDHLHGIAGNGVIALIRGSEPESGVVALRADIDALPISEANEVPYRSRNAGVMHACGHDVHTASLLGVARILSQMKDSFSGTVKLIFQPAEERLPGGAQAMIREGALRDPAPSRILGQHVHPPLEAGKVGFCSGKCMASADEIYITIKGRGGHGALPHQTIDPVVMAANLIVQLQQLVSRYSDPIIPSVLTFGRIESQGGATNVIPNELIIEGTFRTMDENWRKEAHKRMRKMAEGLVTGMGGACDFNIIKGYPYLENDPAITANAREFAVEYLGADQVVDLPMRMSAEDFAYYSQELPACFYRLGVRNEARGITSPVHTDTFDIDEAALETGPGLMAYIALRSLGNAD